MSRVRFDGDHAGYGFFLACKCVRSGGLVSGCTSSGARFFTRSMVLARTKTFIRVGMVWNEGMEKVVSLKQVLKPSN